MTQIRRGDELPYSISHELSLKRRYPHKLQLSYQHDQLSVRYRQGRRERLSGNSCVATQELFCWVSRGKQKVACLRFVEWDIEPLSHEDDLILEMDNHSAEAVELAEVLETNWEIGDLAGIGIIVEFSLAWVSSQAQLPSIILTVANMLIEERFGRTGALLVLKAFPLEYEARGVATVSKHFPRRQAAMIRHYQRQLGVKSIPGGDGQGGWMWKRLHEYTPAPCVP